MINELDKDKTAEDWRKEQRARCELESFHHVEADCVEEWHERLIQRIMNASKQHGVQRGVQRAIDELRLSMRDGNCYQVLLNVAERLEVILADLTPK